MPEIEEMYATAGANSFLAVYNGEAEWNDVVDSGEWYDFKAIIAQLNKDTAGDAAENEDWTRTAESVFDMSSSADLKDVTEEDINEIIRED